MQLPDFLLTKKVVPFESSVKPIWKKPSMKLKDDLTFLPASCMNMFPSVATSAFVTKFVERRSKHSLNFAFGGPGSVVVSKI